MKNVTITLEESVARWARVHAARQGTSVSRLLGELLKEKMLREKGYETARRRFMARAPRVLKADGSTYPVRDELHDRG
ncbi:MAG: CopG family transcriptional regulator [Planctomycetota bacterium]